MSYLDVFKLSLCVDEKFGAMFRVINDVGINLGEIKSGWPSVPVGRNCGWHIFKSSS